MSVDARDLLQFSLGRHNRPRHGEYHTGADRRCQIGLDALDANLGKDGCERRENGGADGVNESSQVLLLAHAG